MLGKRDKSLPSQTDMKIRLFIGTPIRPAVSGALTTLANNSGLNIRYLICLKMMSLLIQIFLDFKESNFVYL